MTRTKEDIEAENRVLRAEYGDLFDSVAGILFRRDPIGINFEHNTDEYEPEVRTILPRLRTCASGEEVMYVVHQEFRKWFGSDLAGTQEDYREIAEEVWVLYKQQQDVKQAFKVIWQPKSKDD